MTTQPKYQDEPTYLRDPIWERGQIEPWELLRICAWKSAKNLGLRGFSWAGPGCEGLIVL
jgi:hypothetical protein